MAGVEADQRLVEQQQLGPADQRLRQQQALPLAARHVAQRAGGEIARADRASVSSIMRAVGAAERGQAPALAIERGADEIAPAQAQVRQHRAHLRQIADRPVAALRLVAEHA